MNACSRRSSRRRREKARRGWRPALELFLVAVQLCSRCGRVPPARYPVVIHGTGASLFVVWSSFAASSQQR